MNSSIHTITQTVTRALACGAVAALVAFMPLTAQAAEAAAQDQNGGQKDEIEYATQSRLAAKELLLAAANAGDRIVAVGEFGNVVYSDDEGQSWTQAKTVPTQATLTDVTFITDKLGYAVGHDAIVLRTRDAGVTWERAFYDPESETPFMTVLFETKKHGFAMGAFSKFVETKDGGETWKERTLSEGLLDDYHLNGAFETKSGAIFVAAEFGVVYRSTDDGASFDRIQTPYEGSFWGGLALDDGSVMVFGMRGNAYRSADNGETWEKIDAGTDKSIAGGVQLDKDHVVLAGLQGYVGYSSDGGQHFTEVTRSDRLGYSAVVKGADGQVIVFGEPGAKVMPDTAAEAEKAVGASYSIANPSGS